MTRHEIHPLAACLPEIPPAEYQDLAEDIKVRGLKDPVLLYEEKILDGRHRERACYEGQVPVQYREFVGSFDEARAEVISLNVRRRNLTEDQKAMILAKLANATRVDASAKGGAAFAAKRSGRPSADLADGQPRSSPAKTPPSPPKQTVEEVAKISGIAPRKIERAKRVQAQATPATVAAVEAGEKTIHAAEHEVAAKKAARANAGKPRPNPNAGRPRTEKEKARQALAPRGTRHPDNPAGNAARKVEALLAKSVENDAEAEAVQCWKTAAALIKQHKLIVEVWTVTR